MFNSTSIADDEIDGIDTAGGVLVMLLTGLATWFIIISFG
jgi:hypothetical protein